MSNAISEARSTNVVGRDQALQEQILAELLPLPSFLLTLEEYAKIPEP